MSSGFKELIKLITFLLLFIITFLIARHFYGLEYIKDTGTSAFMVLLFGGLSAVFGVLSMIGLFINIENFLNW